MNFAKDNGIDIDQLNTHMKVSGRDIVHRVRRSKKRALKSRVSIPIPRFGKVLKQVVKKSGIDIAPKSFEKNVIGSDEKLTSTQTTVYGENIPLKDVIQSKTKRLHAACIFNICSDYHYTSLSLDEIKTRF
jgi:hypothetical protein